MNRIVTLELIGGILLTLLCGWGCMRENRLIAWEEKRLFPLLRRIRTCIRNRLRGPGERTLGE